MSDNVLATALDGLNHWRARALARYVRRLAKRFPPP
jgi:hypothetical protein